MSHKQVGLLLVVFLAMVSVMAACGGGGASAPTSPGSDDSSTLAVAPDFTAQEASGGQVTLTEALQESEKVVLVFYRGVF